MNVFHHIVFFLLLVSMSRLPLAAEPGEDLYLSGTSWKAGIDSNTGAVASFTHCSGIAKWTVPFRKDSKAGPVFEGVKMQPEPGNQYSFSGRRGDIIYGIRYEAHDDHLGIVCTVTNTSNKPYAPDRERLVLGVDSEMRTFPEWDGKFFPTLLRCEKDFAWGYFMSPTGRILAFGVEDPVASYGMNYIFEGNKGWLWGHQIYTASLDLLHSPPLPERHPQDLSEIPAGETRSWILHLGTLDSLDQVKPSVAEWISAPLPDAVGYTLTPGSKAMIKVYGDKPIEKAVMIGPDGVRHPVAGREDAPDTNLAERILETPPLEDYGLYRIEISNGIRQSEVSLYVRKPWSWYLRKARDNVAEYPPFFSASCETFYGYYPAFLGARHFPDVSKDAPLKARFRDGVRQMVSQDGFPLPQANPARIQNFSALAGMFVDLWEADGDEEWLETASGIGDYLSSEHVQWPDGSFRSDSIHYSAVIYPVKSMLELADAEFRAGWKDRAGKHFLSAFRAAEDLMLRLDDIETEGDMTFEDGMITCSALQMAFCGLHVEDPVLRRKFAEAASYMMDKHRCLEQRLIPDCRMRGATLRYWEALDIYFTPNQVMNSPHGWTAWKVYALCYLYLLTGEEHYLDEMMETLGACVQLMELDGHLRWGFMPDPYIEGLVCTPVAGKPQERYMAETVVGEQYMEMISPWLRPADGQAFTRFGEPGGAGDNTVYEIFKALEECVLTTAYVIVTENGDVRCHNCSAGWSAPGHLHVTPDDGCVSRVHINTGRRVRVTADFPSRRLRKTARPGMSWLGEAPYHLHAAVDCNL